MATLIQPDVIEPEPQREPHSPQSSTLRHGHRFWRHGRLYWYRLFYWLRRLNDHDNISLRCSAYHHRSTKE